MSDRVCGIVTPYCFPEDWTIPEGSPSFVTPHRNECTTPPTIREVGIDRVLNRKVTGACCHLGTYGMGGAGFMGVGFADPKEYLVLCVWGADSWLHWDGKIIDDNHTFGKKWGDPSRSQHGHKKYEKEVNGTTLVSFDLFDTHCTLKFDNHILEFREDFATRPFFCGNGKPRKWHAEDSLWDAWFLSPTWRILV